MTKSLDKAPIFDSVPSCLEPEWSILNGVIIAPSYNGRSMIEAAAHCWHMCQWSGHLHARRTAIEAVASLGINCQ